MLHMQEHSEQLVHNWFWKSINKEDTATDFISDYQRFLREKEEKPLTEYDVKVLLLSLVS